MKTETCADELFEEQAERNPQGVAVVEGERQISYRDLNHHSNMLARHLRDLGVGPECRVGIALERSIEMLVALLGIWKAGGAFVPLEPGYPRERLEYVVADAGVELILTQQKLAQLLERMGAQLLCLDKEWEQVGVQSNTPLKGKRNCDHLAYVMYTSGSTGKPKGVEVMHHSVVNFLASMREEPGLTERDRLLAVTTLSFDIAGLELHLPLTTGACVVIAPKAALADGVALGRRTCVRSLGPEEP